MIRENNNGDLVTELVGTIVENPMDKDILHLTNRHNKKTPYRVIKCSVKDNKGKEVFLMPKLFENSRLANDSIFVNGAEISIEMQLAGAGAGYCKINLPSNRADITNFLSAEQLATLEQLAMDNTAGVNKAVASTKKEPIELDE